MLTRRDALGASLSVSGLSLSGLGLCALAIAPPPSSANNAPGNPAAPVPPGALLTTFMRLAASLDDRLVIWWMDGIRYGVVDAICRPLHGMQVGMFHQFERQPDGTYRFAIFELTYYTDLDTGALLTTYANPYTGKTDSVIHVRLGPTVRVQTAEGLTVSPEPAIREYHSRLGPVTVQGDRIWVRTDVEARIVLPLPKAPEIILNHYTTLGGLLVEATDETRASVPADLSFQNIIRWEPWMRMGDRPGHLMSRAIGRKLATVEELPADYLAMAERKHPEYLRDPRGILARTLAKSATAG